MFRPEQGWLIIKNDIFQKCFRTNSQLEKKVFQKYFHQLLSLRKRRVPENWKLTLQNGNKKMFTENIDSSNHKNSQKIIETENKQKDKQKIEPDNFPF